MPRKKIQVVDINDTLSTENADNNDVVDTPPVITETEQHPEGQPIIEQPPETEVKQPEKQTEPDKHVRVNELVPCPKCQKMVTQKTLNYSHKNTCSGEVKPTPTKPKQIPDIDENIPIKSVPPSPPQLIRTISRIPEVKDTAPNRITPEMMREYRNNMRTEQIKMRSDEMKSLFTNGI